jgi:tetratricopeptide (TPR) repeat protein
VLEGAFPRDATFWTDLVARVLTSVEEELARQTHSQRKTFPAAHWWREDVEAVQGAHLEPRAGELEPPPREQRELLLADISAGKPFSALSPRLNVLMQRHERYATRTGDTFYLVRTACNIGMRLLRGGNEPVRHAASARELACLALRFEPANVYAWALWRDALATEGHLEAAELIGWETIRRFPENPQWRTQLALLFVGAFGRHQEAEELLKETIGLFPNDVVAQNQLALLLANQRGRSREAETLLWEVMRKFPKDSKGILAAHTQLANVVGRDPTRLKEAITILQQALVIEPTNNIAMEMKRRFEHGRTSLPPPSATPSEPSSAQPVGGILPANIAVSARMRRVLFRVRTTASAAHEAALQEIKTMLREDENLAYARYVAAATGVGELTIDDTLLPVAFLAAGSEGSTETLKPILERSRGLEGVIISLASASRGDEEAAMRLKAWLAEPANDLSPRDHGLRVIAERVAGPMPIEFVGDMLAASLGTALAA